MIVPKGKKGLSCSLGQLKLLLLRDMIVPGGKPTSFEETPKFLRGTNLSKLVAIKIISYLFLYSLLTYHWKGLEKNYNFVVGRISIKTYMQKL